MFAKNPVLAARLARRMAAAAPIANRIVMQDGQTVFGRTQDCTAIAESCKVLQSEGEHGSGEMRHAAKIPNVLIEKYCNDQGITFEEWMRDPVHARRMCNDPANAMFRIWPGRV